MTKMPDRRDVAAKEYTKRHVLVYVFGSLLLLAIGLAVLGTPLVYAYLTGGQYDAEKLNIADRKLALLHEGLWQDMRLGSQQFWLGRVKGHLANFLSFLDAQEDRVIAESDNLLTDLDNLLIDYQKWRGTQAIFYFVDEAGVVQNVVGSQKPQWESLDDLWLLYDEFCAIWFFGR